MLLLLDTSTGLCKLTIIEGTTNHEFEWQADRGLADGLLAYLEIQLASIEKSWTDITGLGVFKGPGSFTGLRIGITSMNAIAQALEIPIVGGQGDDWKTEIVTKLENGIDERVVMPEYGRDANITKPRK